MNIVLSQASEIILKRNESDIKVGDKFRYYKKGSGDLSICEVVDIVQRRSLVTGKTHKTEYLVKDKKNKIFQVNEKNIRLTKIKKK